MDELEKLKNKKKKVLKYLTFPQTVKENAIIEISFRPNWDEIKDIILKDINLKNTTIKNKICLILDEIILFSDDLLLEKFDNIIVCQNGLNILKIRNDDANCGRSVNIDISTYDRITEEIKNDKFNNLTTNVFIGLIVFLVLGYTWR
jgi:uncharacterized membrane-anchored protein YjiN (DUF445 family)